MTIGDLLQAIANAKAQGMTDTTSVVVVGGEMYDESPSVLNDAWHQHEFTISVNENQ